jgi:Asp-tRNA(Asn)/Glu-tRNA(Gln) amidotransferase A subunit family amidase
LVKSQWSFKTAVEVSAALRAKKVSAVELARDAIARIERHDGKINAICVRDFDRGLEAARAADAALARGEEKPLLSIPLTAKEPTTSLDYRRPGAFRRKRIFGLPKMRCRLLVSRTPAA